MINLSLLNTDWYILELKNKWNVPISLRDEQIKWVDTRRPDGSVISIPAQKYYDPFERDRALSFQLL